MQEAPGGRWTQDIPQTSLCQLPQSEGRGGAPHPDESRHWQRAEPPGAGLGSGTGKSPGRCVLCPSVSEPGRWATSAGHSRGCAARGAQTGTRCGDIGHGVRIQGPSHYSPGDGAARCLTSRSCRGGSGPCPGLTAPGWRELWLQGAHSTTALPLSRACSYLHMQLS